MKIKFEKILKSEVFKKGIIKKAVVARADGKIVYITKNWKLKPSDIKQCISSWQNKGQSIQLRETKYSCLKSELEFFSGVNYKKKSFLIGAASPEENDKYYVLGYAPPKSNGRNAYVDVVRAANQMKKSGSYMESSVQLGKYSNDEISAGGSATGATRVTLPEVNPALKQEINDFIQWIQDSNGLSAHIRYYLDVNDPTMIAKIAKAYNEFRQVFGF